MGIQLKVFRFNPDADTLPYYSQYDIETSDVTSILMLLRYIYENVDRTLAFRTYHCARGLCGSCRLLINGKIAKGCETLCSPGESYVLEPLPNHPIVRDLVVDEGIQVFDKDRGSYITKKEGTILQRPEK